MRLVDQAVDRPVRIEDDEGHLPYVRSGADVYKRCRDAVEQSDGNAINIPGGIREPQAADFRYVLRTAA